MANFAYNFNMKQPSYISLVCICVRINKGRSCGGNGERRKLNRWRGFSASAAKKGGGKLPEMTAVRYKKGKKAEAEDTARNEGEACSGLSGGFSRTVTRLSGFIDGEQGCDEQEGCEILRVQKNIRRKRADGEKRGRKNPGSGRCEKEVC